ncbi:MAG: radical SAM protein [Methanobacteriaceae archaeon]|jgi:putative pyruvate formate lyase activating enzyme
MQRSTENSTIKEELSTYFEIMPNKRPSRSKVAMGIEAWKSDINSLWEEHESLRADFNDKYHEFTFNDLKKPEFSYLDLKIKIAENIFENCYFCERRCYVNRNTNTGFCGVLNSKIASEFLHIGEEAPLVPSHTIFFTGCNFRCVYCQNFDISQFPGSGMEISEENLAKIIDRRRMEGSRNVNFVGGDPTPNLLYILKTMRLTKENIPVIWNSNFYMSEDAMKLLDGFVDLYLSDFKYGPSDCAQRLSGVPNYWDIITRNHLMAKKAGDMIIRHLVLSNHVECCSKPILKWIRENLGKKTVVNIMGQYRPVYRANEFLEIMRYPDHEEIEETMNYAKRIGLINLV